ncbi:CRTAC1 family protein [Halomonas denitrificans]|nr:CRTAC1 family protein [Halomonas denitrificans]
MFRSRILARAFLLSGLPASVAVADVQFVDVSATAGFEPGLDATIPAGGIAVADFDRNGYPDIFVTGFDEPNRLFFNDGAGAFTEDPVINAQLQGSQCSTTAAADYDNDGWIDLYFGCRGGSNRLLRNTGSGFEDVTTAAVDHDPMSTNGPRTDAVAWGDLDRNGLADLFVGIYPVSTPADPNEPLNRDRMLLQTSPGVWSDAALDFDYPSLARPALAAMIADIDRDGASDLYVVNDKEVGNSLWRNVGLGCSGVCMVDVAPASGADRPVFGMGIAAGDIDRDGLVDLYFSSIGEQVLLRATGDDPLAFEEHQDAAGVNHPGIGWATIFSDFDHDGYEDAYLAIMPTPGGTPDGADQCSRNLGDGTFENVTAQSGLGNDIVTISAARIDYDRDGRMDLVLGHSTQGYRLYRNQSTAGNWIGFRLEGGGPGVTRDALGAWVEIETADGIQLREMRAGESRGSSHDPVLHFGLADAVEADVTIVWPDGTIEDIGPLDAGRYHHRAHPQFDPLFDGSFESGAP